MDFQKMMKQAQEMQFKLQEVQEKLKDINVEAEAGGGLVKVSMSCAGRVVSVNIDESLMGDKETLEDLVTAAMNNVNDVKEERIKTETQKMMKDLGLPEGAAGSGLI